MNPEAVEAIHEQAAQQMRNAVFLLNEGVPPFKWDVQAYDSSTEAAVLVAKDQAHLLLAWGDGTVTTFRDTGSWTWTWGSHEPATELQRRLMVTRLRFLADRLEAMHDDAEDGR